MLQTFDVSVQNALINVKPGLEKYQGIMNQIMKVDVSTDSEFQKKYNHFYRMRQRNQLFYETYFDYLEKNKNSASITFDETLLYFYETLNRVEPSFSSKLVHSINPNFPIWDAIVLDHLNLKKPGSHRKNRVMEMIDVYKEIQSFYDEFLKTDEAAMWLDAFNDTYKEARISNVKKIDFILWQTR